MRPGKSPPASSRRVVGSRNARRERGLRRLLRKDDVVEYPAAEIIVRTEREDNARWTK